MNTDVLLLMIKHLSFWEDINSLSLVNRDFHYLISGMVERISQQLRLPWCNSMGSLRICMHTFSYRMLKKMCKDGIIRKQYQWKKHHRTDLALYHAAKRRHSECFNYIISKSKNIREDCTHIVRGAIRSRRYDIFQHYHTFADLNDWRIQALAIIYPSPYYACIKPMYEDVKDAIIDIKGKTCKHTGLFYYHAKNNIPYTSTQELTFRAAKYAIKYNFQVELFHPFAQLYYLFKYGRYNEYMTMYREMCMNRPEYMCMREYNFTNRPMVIEDYTLYLEHKYLYARGYSRARRGPTSIIPNIERTTARYGKFDTIELSSAYESFVPALYIPLRKYPTNRRISNSITPPTRSTTNSNQSDTVSHKIRRPRPVIIARRSCKTSDSSGKISTTFNQSGTTVTGPSQL